MLLDCRLASAKETATVTAIVRWAYRAF
eukprot:COSAG02_NODE_37198_length_445_cov_0.656069_1_plen_27_part_01